MTAPTDVLGKRIAAFLIDWLLLGLAYWGTFFAFAEKTTDDTSGSALFAKLTLNGETWAIADGRAGLFFVVWLVFGTVYTGVLPGLRGWTPGKLALGLRLVRPETGLPPGASRGIGRSIATIIDLFPYFLPMLVGLVAASSSPSRRRIADRIAGTVVIRADAVGMPVALGEAPAAAPAGPAPAVTLGVRETHGAAPTHTTGTPTSPPPPAPPAAAAQPANWYPDPGGEKRLRWWDGSRWTDHTAD